MPVDFDRSSTTALVEVALSVGFEEIHRMLRYELDDLWDQKYAEEFPTDEEKAPHKPFIEDPDGGLVALPSASPITNIRRWFGSEDGAGLVQVQRNWFARNWRATLENTSNGAVTPYPGYASVRSDFAESLQGLVDFVTHADLGEFKPLQCEVSYRFQLRAEGLWDGPGALDRVLRMFSANRGSYLPDLEAMRIITQYPMSGETGKRRGRLYARIETGAGEDGSEFLILTMFARGTPDGLRPEDVYAFQDDGQQWIVNGLREFLTPEALAWYNLD